MKINVATISDVLNRFQVNLQDRGFLLAVAIARAVGYRLPIPTSPVINPQDHFENNYVQEAEQMLSEVNEQVVLNLDTTVDLISRIWLFRYRLVHDSQNIAVRSFLDALIRTGTRELPPSVSEVLIRYCQSDNADILDILTRTVAEALAPTVLTVSTEDDTPDDTQTKPDAEGAADPDNDKPEDQDGQSKQDDTSSDDKALALAKDFHETYERLAPEFGYQTREDTRTFDPESANGKLMVAVAKEILAKLKSEGA